MLACGESWGGVDARALVFFVKSDFTFKEIFVYYLLNEFDYSFFFFSSGCACLCTNGRFANLAI